MGSGGKVVPFSGGQPLGKNFSSRLEEQGKETNRTRKITSARKAIARLWSANLLLEEVPTLSGGLQKKA